MNQWGEMEVAPATAGAVPAWPDVVDGLRRVRHRADETLRAADAAGRPFVQPRCGVGGHGPMRALLTGLAEAGPGMLSITIDSHTRLRQFDTAARVLAEDPARLNGYPLVAHGWRRGRELTRTVDVPLEVRHGSPDARDLFAVALASGITSFEGGGIGYNLPYSKDVPLRVSLESWRQLDDTCGRLAAEGVVIDRELFGTLTAVLVPPSISLAVTMLEAVAAARSGVRCLSIAYPQGGEVHQDVAALRSIRTLARRYLPDGVAVHPVLHEFMGVFPARRADAEALVLYGGITARLGGATKVISKTRQEALGIPDTAANAEGIRVAAMGSHELLDFVRLDQARVEEEADWIQREVAELVEPVLAASDLADGIVRAFASGRLDIPFSASVHARSEVIPARDDSGAIRLYRTGNLPLSDRSRRRNAALAERAARGRPIDAITADINYFAREGDPR
ncbi:methylaspartate mutase [Spongiactinospora sp. TRM90649]|uniref:methylaspartate mutase n=1 Tax=Spongiactinospora sp. TRM90649 TaxID=3031114 RepID=UPI0023F70046|nr:methylaspartate mutase [Spongiactinospora sp. TRM90649]MDF5753263.1 methylaspartate mutase [Spongiactinospora sp. TRM90649]